MDLSDNLLNDIKKRKKFQLTPYFVYTVLVQYWLLLWDWSDLLSIHYLKRIKAGLHPTPTFNLSN